MASKLAKYATHGAVSAGVYQMMNPGAKSIKLTLLGNTEVPLLVVSAGMGVAASALSDIMSDWILPNVQDNKKLAKLEGAVVQVASGGLGFVGAGYLANPDLLNADGQAKQLFITGAVSELAAQWVYENVVSVYMY